MWPNWEVISGSRGPWEEDEVMRRQRRKKRTWPRVSAQKSLLWTSRRDLTEHEHMECFLKLSEEGVLGCLFIGFPFISSRYSLHSKYICSHLVSTPPPRPLFMASEDPQEEATICQPATSRSPQGTVWPDHSWNQKISWGRCDSDIWNVYHNMLPTNMRIRRDSRLIKCLAYYHVLNKHL